METVIAIGIVAVLLSTFLAVFGPATQNIRRAVSAKDAERLTGALEQWMTSYDPDRSAQTGAPYDTAFDRAFDAVVAKSTNNSELALIAYQYRADPENRRTADQSFQPFTGDLQRSIAGKDYVLKSVVRPLNEENTLIRDDVAAIEGRAFFVKLRPLQKTGAPGSREFKPLGDNGGSNVQAIINNLPGDQGNSIDTVNYVPFQAEFYALPSTAPGFMQNGAENYIRTKIFPTTGDGLSPVLVQNMVLTR